MIKLLFGKVGIYGLIIAGLSTGFLVMRNHYINVGIEECKTKIGLAVLAENKRMNEINIRTLRDINSRANKLQDEKDELSELLSESENANENEPDASCLSADRMYRINQVGGE